MPKAQCQQVEQYLRAALIDDSKLARAWAYHGFYWLAEQYPQYTADVEHFFTLAFNDEAPSVKARVRQLQKRNKSKLYGVNHVTGAPPQGCRNGDLPAFYHYFENY